MFGGKCQEACYLSFLWRALNEIQEETRNLAVTLQYLLNEESLTPDMRECNHKEPAPTLFFRSVKIERKNE